MSQSIQLKFPLGEREITGLRESVSRQLHDAQVGGELVYALVNVIDEICCNLMEYSAASWMEIEVRPAQTKVDAELRDDGVPFDPTAAIDSMDASQPATVTERRLGLYMVGLMTQDLKYVREGNVNRLTFSMIRN